MKKVVLLGVRVLQDLAIEEDGKLTRLKVEPVHVYADEWPAFPGKMADDIKAYENKLNSPPPPMPDPLPTPTLAKARKLAAQRKAKR